MLTLSQKGEESIFETNLFGKYRLIRKLGQGNSSTVYLAEHTELKVYRAVKCIPKTQAFQPHFFLETDILKNLRHPGIPIIYDIGENDTSFYIIEEYIQGESLEAYALHQDCIPTEDIIYIMQKLCDVLQYLHEQEPNPIIYQDVKPEHIILCEGRIVLVDFGIASYMNQQGNTFSNFGTEGYAPPEKYQGFPCDARTDIYGLGKVLEYLMNKVPPLEFPILMPIMQKALAPLPEERFPTVGAFLEGIQGCLQNGDQNIYPNETKHLLKKIAIVGTQRRVGTTHIGIALSCFFNQKKRPCIYQELHETDCMRSLVREAGGLVREGGLITHGLFRGMPYYGEGIERQEWDTGFCIQDYGTNYQEIEENSGKMILVIGTRPWEMDASRHILDHLSLRQNLVLICNYGDREQAKRIAKEYSHRTYCFPLDEDPFRRTREKWALFQKLLKQEGW